MPTVGLGTYKMTPEELRIAIPAALDAGYRSFDTAASYKNEKAIGEILSRELPERNLGREDVFITTKLRPADQGYDKALSALVKSANFLGGYIDLYLIHWPGAAKVHPDDPRNESLRSDTWRALQDAYYVCRKVNESENNTVTDQCSLTDGEQAVLNTLNGVYLRSIGVSNFNINHIESLVASPFFQTYPHVNQYEIHPGYHTQELTAYCEQHFVHVQAYSSLGCGKLLETEFLERFPQVQHMAQKRVASYLSAAEHSMQCTKQSFFDEANVKMTCTVWVYLRWAVQHGYSIIPKSTNPQRIRDNYLLTLHEYVMEFNLTADEMDSLNSIADNPFCRKICWDGSTIK